MSDFGPAARRLSRAFAEDAAPSGEDHAAVRAGLIRALLARFRSLGPDELLDVVDEAVIRLLSESRRQGSELDKPAGWLVRTASNMAHDRVRRQARSGELRHEPWRDDETFQLIEAAWSSQSIRTALAQAVAAGEWTVVTVVTAWIDLASETGSAPSSRQVGQRVELSHTTVNEALNRFRGMVDH